MLDSLPISGSTDSYTVRTKFYKPAIYRTSNDPEPNNEGDPVVEFITPLDNYTPFQLQCLINRVTIGISEYINEGVVEYYRPIIDDEKDNYVYLFIHSRGRVVVPIHDNMVIPTEEFIPSNQCIEPGSEILTLNRFKEIVDYWENNYTDYGVVACHSMKIEKGIIPKWWIATIVHRIDLDWLANMVLSNPDYNYIIPEFVAIDGCLLMRVDYTVTEYLDDRLNVFNEVTRIINEIIINLYDQGAMANVSESMRSRLQYKLHQSGLLIPTWYDILIMDMVRMADRCRALDAIYVPLPEGLRVNQSKNLINRRVVVFDGNNRQLVNSLLTL